MPTEGVGETVDDELQTSHPPDVGGAGPSTALARTTRAAPAPDDVRRLSPVPQATGLPAHGATLPGGGRLTRRRPALVGAASNEAPSIEPGVASR